MLILGKYFPNLIFEIFKSQKLRLIVPLMLISTLIISGCAFVVGGAATGGGLALQERSVGDAVDDFTIRAELNQLFFEENIDLLQSVSFTVIEGRVLLKGSVLTQEDRILALQIAWQAGGVREVINEIQITDQGGVVNYARDTWISTQLKTELLFDSDVYAINYNIETLNGIIYIVGIARTTSELDKVIGHARRINNVKKVVSHVILKDDPRRTPGP
tara:strand:+ start:112 stop:762 length:651 start_codon:yes stop_codon:yes gene_type:complete